MDLVFCFSYFKPGLFIAVSEIAASFMFGGSWFYFARL